MMLGLMALQREHSGCLPERLQLALFGSIVLQAQLWPEQRALQVFVKKPSPHRIKMNWESGEELSLLIFLVKLLI